MTMLKRATCTSYAKIAVDLLSEPVYFTSRPI